MSVWDTQLANAMGTEIMLTTSSGQVQGRLVDYDDFAVMLEAEADKKSENKPRPERVRIVQTISRAHVIGMAQWFSLLAKM